MQHVEHGHCVDPVRIGGRPSAGEAAEAAVDGLVVLRDRRAEPVTAPNADRRPANDGDGLGLPPRPTGLLVRFRPGASGRRHDHDGREGRAYEPTTHTGIVAPGSILSASVGYGWAASSAFRALRQAGMPFTTKSRSPGLT
jgi:hypothetical protein